MLGYQENSMKSNLLSKKNAKNKSIVPSAIEQIIADKSLLSSIKPTNEGIKS